MLHRDRVVIVSRQVSRLKELWAERKSVSPDLPDPEFIEGTIGEGWILTNDEKQQFHLLTDSEIFGWDRPQPRVHTHINVEAPESAYGDLKAGDWVVHVDYGIGRYVGLVARTLEGSNREYLCMEYDDGDQVFVPIHQADRLSSLHWSGREMPDWRHPPAPRNGRRPSSKVREAVEEWHRSAGIVRQTSTGVPGLCLQLRPSLAGRPGSQFPYVEYGRSDPGHHGGQAGYGMNVRPMDRLLCGDVGYGKTEVALRAAFKAVMDGKQVAVLVPTTVLAQQHYEPFASAFSLPGHGRNALPLP